MLKPLKLPRGICNLFAIGDSATISLPEKWNHRPDKILESVGCKSMKNEIINNYMSVTSPISLKKGDPYVITDNLFNKYFFKSGD